MPRWSQGHSSPASAFNLAGSHWVPFFCSSFSVFSFAVAFPGLNGSRRQTKGFQLRVTQLIPSKESIPTCPHQPPEHLRSPQHRAGCLVHSEGDLFCPQCKISVSGMKNLHNTVDPQSSQVWRRAAQSQVGFVKDKVQGYHGMQGSKCKWMTRDLITVVFTALLRMGVQKTI